MRTLEISATEFKAKCLDLMDRLASGELDEVSISKRGRPVALLKPPRQDRPGLEPGFLKQQTRVPDDFDWDAFRAESNRLWLGAEGDSDSDLGGRTQARGR